MAPRNQIPNGLRHVGCLEANICTYVFDRLVGLINQTEIFLVLFKKIEIESKLSRKFIFPYPDPLNIL